MIKEGLTMQFTETIKNKITSYQYILDNYYLDTYSNIVEDFADEYEMLFSDIQKLMTYELYMEVVKESNSNEENIIENSFKLIQKRLFLSEYDIFQPTGKMTI